MTAPIIDTVWLRELVTVVPLLALSLFLGFYPKPLFDRSQTAVKDLVRHVEQTTDYKAPGPPGTTSAAGR